MKKLAQDFNPAAQDLYPGLLSQESEALPLSHCALTGVCVKCHVHVLVFTVAVTYSLETATRGTHSGTLFTERGEIYVPRILQNFTNKTTIEAHTEILQNFKFLLESDSTEPPV